MSKVLGNVLDETAFRQFNARQSTVIVATVSGDGYPNTTPVHLIIAFDRSTLLMGMNQKHQGVANIRSSGKVMINLCEQDDLNISIRCDASVFLEKMQCNPHMCVVKAEILEIKDDSTHSETTSGIRYRCRTEKGAVFIKGVFEELFFLDPVQ